MKADVSDVALGSVHQACRRRSVSVCEKVVDDMDALFVRELEAEDVDAQSPEELLCQCWRIEGWE